MSYYVENMIDNQITYVEDRMFQNMLPRNLPYETKREIVAVIKTKPEILQLLLPINDMIYDQVSVGSVMAINALIGLIPIPVIPGILRTVNNIIYQILMTKQIINSLKDVADQSTMMIETDPDIRRILIKDGIDIRTLKLNPDKMSAIKKAEDSLRKEFDKIDIKYIQDGILTKQEIYDKINELALEAELKKQNKQGDDLGSGNNTSLNAPVQQSTNDINIPIQKIDEKDEKNEKDEKDEKDEKHEKGEQHEKHEKHEKGEQHEKHEKGEQHEKHEKHEKDEQHEKQSLREPTTKKEISSIEKSSEKEKKPSIQHTPSIEHTQSIEHTPSIKHISEHKLHGLKGGKKSKKNIKRKTKNIQKKLDKKKSKKTTKKKHKKSKKNKRL